MLPDDARDPSASGFETAEAAWEFVYGRMCPSCCEERERALEGSEGYNESPACSAEWLVLRTADLDECETLGDVLDAAGYDEVIYTRPVNTQGPSLPGSGS